MTQHPDIPTEHAFAPHPVVKHIVTVVQQGQRLNPEQQERVAAWLQANGVEPSNVARDEITLEYRMFGEQPGRRLIGFTQYYREDGHIVHSVAQNDAVTFHRYVEQKVPLDPDPSWPGFNAYRAAQARQGEGT